MLSTHNEKHLQKIPSLSAESIMLNLEDGVGPEQKPKALALCMEYLEKYSHLEKMFIVRINPLDEGGIEEIKHLNHAMPDAIRIPKVQTSKDVQKALELIDPKIDVHLSIESAQAWKNLSELKLDQRVSTFYLGILDLFADMGLSHSIIKKDNATMNYILAHFLMTCKSMGVKPVSFVYQDYKNLDDFSEWVELERSLGYTSKGCISPSQVEIVNALFALDDLEAEKARKIITLFETHSSQGITGFVDDEFGFIDEPIYKGAKALLGEKYDT